MSQKRVAVETPPGWGTAARARSPARSLPVDRHLLRLIQARLGRAPVRLALWDGWSAYAGPDPVGCLTFRTRRALVRTAWHPDLWFGEAYMTGQIDVDGGLATTLETIDEHARDPMRPPRTTRSHAPGHNTIPRSRHNVHHHYDLGNEFYGRWLDRDLSYTCAYFPTETCSLETAQTAKMDLVCRKLRLEPGERVVEAGCGWGSLALHMARHYGVTVSAFNLSGEQVRYARERAAQEGLEKRVEYVEADYRTIKGSFDAFVSVGMLEHVGLADYGTLGGLIRGVLVPGRGRALLHFIGRTAPRPLNAWIRRRIFPGAHPPSLAEFTTGVTEPWNLTVIDVENLRRHYALTLRHWLDRFEIFAASPDCALDAAFVRAWRLYLAGSLVAFRHGSLQLYQVLLTRDRDDGLPATREDLYRGRVHSGIDDDV